MRDLRGGSGPTARYRLVLYCHLVGISRRGSQPRGRIACLCRAEKSVESGVARVLAVLSLDTAPGQNADGGEHVMKQLEEQARVKLGKE